MSVIPEDVSPDALRQEANRRELVARHRTVHSRRAARNRVVDALRAIDRQDIVAAGAHNALFDALARLANDEVADRAKEPTNGEVGLAGPGGWWNPMLAEKVAPHPILREIETHRKLTW